MANPETTPHISPDTARAALSFLQSRMPAGGLFGGYQWRAALQPFALGETLARQLNDLGRVLLKFYRATNLLYRQSVEGKQPSWIAALLDQGKPASVIERQRAVAFKQATPRVLRPDVLLLKDGFAISELDSVPGGIGLTAWLNQVYTELGTAMPEIAAAPVLGGPEGMQQGFASIFGNAPRVHVMVSAEAATYRPEMEWLCGELNQNPSLANVPGAAQPRFSVRDVTADGMVDGEAAYRFFELFDLPNLPGAEGVLNLAEQKQITLTPPPKPVLEEKLLFALLWNRNLREFWRRELGERFFEIMLSHAPRTWVMDPSPLPPHAALPGLEITDWRQLKAFSQRERDMIIKVSGFSELAWGARGVYLGSDLSQGDWSAAVDTALASFPKNPYILQQFRRPDTRPALWFDESTGTVAPFEGRVRLCPYYFIAGEGDSARATLGGILATICPADKKIIHGMSDAVLAPCCA